MRREAHRALIQQTEELRDLIRGHSTETIVGMCAVRFGSWQPSADRDFGLVSPLRQLQFLLGIMLSTPEPDRGKDFGDEAWDTSVQYLNSIFGAYADMYWESPDERARRAPDPRPIREVSMPAFLDYFNSGVMASVDMLAERIQRYLAPFDEQLRLILQLDASESLRVANWIGMRLQSVLDRLQSEFAVAEATRRRLVARAEREGWSAEKLRAAAKRPQNSRAFRRFFSTLSQNRKISRRALVQAFGQRIGAAYWAAYASRRGSAPTFTYLTEYNPAADRPIVEVTDGLGLVPFGNEMFVAILRVMERKLLESDFKAAFLRNRDLQLETQVEEQFRRIFPADAEIFPRVFETAARQHEHDLAILWQDKLFVIESKASPPAEPFRDPQRAFNRIQRAFKADTGIQHGYDQANSIRTTLKGDPRLTLYWSNGRPAVHLDRGRIETIHEIVVTRDNFGPIAADLSPLLSKDAADPYPWAVGIFDLTYMVDGWSYLGWGAKELCAYLDQRVLLHGKVFSADEMELAGFFVQHGSLHHLVELQADRITLVPEYAYIFDKIYAATQGGPPFQLTVTPPVDVNLTAELARVMSESANH